MPMYHFHLHDDKTLSDIDGTEFVDAAEARSHAIGAARVDVQLWRNVWTAIGLGGECRLTR